METRKCGFCGIELCIPKAYKYKDGLKIAPSFCSRPCQGQVYGNRKHLHGSNQKGRTKEYRTWINMKQRCRPDYIGHERYFDRGIVVCEEWKEFSVFLASVGICPDPKLSLDRIDNNGIYEPGNVRWATAKQQANNRRKAKPRRWARKPV